MLVFTKLLNDKRPHWVDSNRTHACKRLPREARRRHAPQICGVSEPDCICICSGLLFRICWWKSFCRPTLTAPLVTCSSGRQRVQNSAIIRRCRRRACAARQEVSVLHRRARDVHACGTAASSCKHGCSGYLRQTLRPRNARQPAALPRAAATHLRRVPQRQRGAEEGRTRMTCRSLDTSASICSTSEPRRPSAKRLSCRVTTAVPTCGSSTLA